MVLNTKRILFLSFLRAFIVFHHRPLQTFLARFGKEGSKCIQYLFFCKCFLPISFPNCVFAFTPTRRFTEWLVNTKPIDIQLVLEKLIRQVSSTTVKQQCIDVTVKPH